jgi:hypothetical protein
MPLGGVATADGGGVIDEKTAKSGRRTLVLCIALGIPALIIGFCVGKTSPDWTLEDRSVENAKTMLEKMVKAGPVIQEVQAKTAAAVTKAEANQVDEEFVTYLEEGIQDRPFTASDLDRVNYAVFEPQTVDNLYEFAVLIDRTWLDLANHRTATKADVNAIKNIGFMGEKSSQVVLGLALMSIYDDMYGGVLGVISNPSLDSDRNKTVDVQARPGRPSDPLRIYTSGAFGEKISDWIIPIDAAVTGSGGPLEGSVKSHWDSYVARLGKIGEEVETIVRMHGELTAKLRAITE